MRVDVFPINSTLGDITGNQNKILEAFDLSAQNQCDLLVTPECALSGYPPEDLMLRPAFLLKIKESVATIAEYTKTQDTALLLGTPWHDREHIINAALFIHKGNISIASAKQILPDFGVFDDSRIFASKKLSAPIHIQDKKFGVLICEDMWHEHPIKSFEKDNIDGVISINASPFENNKHELRVKTVQKRVKEIDLPFLAVFNSGAQDHLIYDGRSFACNNKGQITAHHKPFDENILSLTFENKEFSGNIDSISYSSEELMYRAVMYGLRHYMQKNGFKKIVLGLSGGVDSVLSSSIAVDAIGAENVTVILLPSQYTSEESFQDAYDTIHALGIEYHTVSIAEGVEAASQSLAPLFEGLKPDLTEENLQSRMRGLYLMAYSNKFGHMVLTTGNKSEMAVGYATLYGDMNGGYNALKDLYKTEVYKLCHYRNHHKPIDALGPDGIVIPENVIKKEPSAELRPDQKDSDSLPDYDILDDILEKLIEKEMSVSDIVQTGHTLETVKHIWHLVNISEYKRRQSALGAKVTSQSFDRERRYPITNKFRG